MPSVFLASGVSVVAFTVVQVGAFIVLLTRAKGKARTYGAVGVGLSLLSLAPVLLMSRVNDPASLTFLALSLLPGLLNMVGFCLLVSAIVIGSRPIATPELPGVNPNPPQDYIQQRGGQNFSQWG